MKFERILQVCLLIEDTDFDNFTLDDGSVIKSGKYAGSLRRFLMREHLGLLSGATEEVGNKMVMDPVPDKFYKDIWLRTASVNTKCYDDAFLVVPTDRVKTMDECFSYEQRTPLAEFDRIATNRILDGVKVRFSENYFKFPM